MAELEQWWIVIKVYVRDYEYTLLSSDNWLYLTNIQLMLQRIEPDHKDNSPTRS